MPKRRAARKAEEVLESFLVMDPKTCNVTVSLASVGGANEQLSFEQLQLSDNLTDEFRAVAVKALDALRDASENGDLRVVAYDPGSKPDSHEVELVDLSAYDSVRSQIRSLSSVADVPSFQAKQEFMTGLRFYVIIVQCQGSDPLYLFRAYSHKKEIGRSGKIAAIFSAGTFDKLKDPVFLFDRRVHCMSLGDSMLVFSQDSFHKIFRFFEELLKTAKKTLTIIEKQVPIFNFKEFAAACEGHVQMQAKLKNISNRPYLKNLKMSAMKKVIKKVGLDVKVVEKGGQEMLEFDPKNKWELLRLLDDDYLQSIMTATTYEVNSKRAL